MAALNFPASPTVGQKYPAPAVAGQPVYTWDGEKWMTVGPLVGGGGSIMVSDTPPASPVAGNLWFESDTGKLFLRFDDGTSQQWIDAAPAAPPAAGGGVPAGSVMLFYNSAAPLGWTRVTTHHDKGLRVVGSTAGGVAGGTNAFSSVMAQSVTGNTTPTLATTAAHTHSAAQGVTYSGDVNWTPFDVAGGGTLFYGFPTGSAGSGTAHSHPVTMDIQYLDMIVASKD